MVNWPHKSTLLIITDPPNVEPTYARNGTFCFGWSQEPGGERERDLYRVPLRIGKGNAVILQLGAVLG